MRHPVANAGAWFVVAVLLAACGNGDADGASETTTTSTRAPATTETTVDEFTREERAAADAYLAAADAALATFAPPAPDPDHPDLLATHTGPMLAQRRDVAAGMRAAGQAIERPEDSRFRVEVVSVMFDEVDGEDVAFLDVCSVDDGETFVVETGEVIVDGLVTVQSIAVMRRVDGEWMLAERREEDRWDGEDGCAVG